MWEVGVRQGENFPPLVLLYYDDTIIMAETEKSLKDALAAFEAYCDLWKLKVNISKAKLVCKFSI